MRVNAAAEKIPRVSELKGQLLEQMIDRCEAELGGDFQQGAVCSAVFEFADIFTEFADIFTDDGELDRTSKIKHFIHMDDA